jgi:hypothetical protein
MHIRTNQVRVVVVLVALAFLLIALLALYLAGCTDTLDGEVYENQKPIVHFANIPPEGGRFSRNETVYWYGTDPDGLIDYYRYYTAKVSDVGFMAPEDYILTIPDSDWIYIDIDSAQNYPQTENIIPLAADFDDPVNTYVSQWIFLQAFDMESLGSDIVFRLFSRNDHPPETSILPIAPASLPFVNGDSGGIVTGVKLAWSGSDRLDYPEADWPPFEFEWRLYGPYDSSLFRNVVDSFVRCVFVTIYGFVYEEGDTVIRCDTTYGDSTIIECDTFAVSDLCSGDEDVPSWGHLEMKFSVDDTSFINNPVYNKLVDCSCGDDPPPDDPTKDCVDPWVLNTSDVLYDVYKHAQFDTTVQMWFLFWIRCRDDAFVADLVPTFDSFPVIDPRYERDVVVVDFAGMPSASWCLPLKEVRTAYWVDAINNWGMDAVENWTDTSFDTTGIGGNIGGKGISPDYIDVARTLAVPLVMLLKHKVVILYDDFISGWRFNKYSHNVYTAIDAGANVWATWRVPLEPSADRHEISIPSEYTEYFGVSEMAYSDWFKQAVDPCWGLEGVEPARVEDFIGAYAIDSLEWPNLTIDTALLHNRFQWPPYASLDSCLGFMPSKTAFPYLPPSPAFPEVNWSVRTPRRPTEVLYLYKSAYGSDHPEGGIYNMEGNPVAHRLSTTQFRTVHFNFTPLPIQQDSMQKVVNKVLDWLYPSDLSSPPSKIRYPDAPVKVSISQARERYWQRCEERAREKEMQQGQQGALR